MNSQPIASEIITMSYLLYPRSVSVSHITSTFILALAALFGNVSLTAAVLWEYSVTDGVGNELTGTFTTNENHLDAALAGGTHTFSVASFGEVFYNGVSQTLVWGTTRPSHPTLGEESFTYDFDNPIRSSAEEGVGRKTDHIMGTNNLFDAPIAFANGGSATITIGLGSSPANTELTRVTIQTVLGVSIQRVDTFLSFQTASTTFTPVPEPTTYAVAMGALGALYVIARRRGRLPAS